MRVAKCEVSRFADPAALLAYLHDAEGDPEAKNGVLRALVRHAQGAEVSGETAKTLMLLALWPGLDACRGRLGRQFRSEPELLVAELTGRLSAAIATIDLERVTRIAATLLRNVERDVKRDLVRTRSRIEVGDVEDMPARDPDRRPEQVMAELRRRLGRDGTLVFLVDVAGLSQKEAAYALGLTHAAARKRHQRAMRRLSEQVEQEND